jgi:hypothetical protein
MSKKISTTVKGKQNQGLARCCIAASKMPRRSGPRAAPQQTPPMEKLTPPVEKLTPSDGKAHPPPMEKLTAGSPPPMEKLNPLRWKSSPQAGSGQRTADSLLHLLGH